MKYLELLEFSNIFVKEISRILIEYYYYLELKKEALLYFTQGPMVEQAMS